MSKVKLFSRHFRDVRNTCTMFNTENNNDTFWKSTKTAAISLSTKTINTKHQTVYKQNTNKFSHLFWVYQHIYHLMCVHEFHCFKAIQFQNDFSFSCWKFPINFYSLQIMNYFIELRIVLCAVGITIYLFRIPLQLTLNYLLFWIDERGTYKLP